MRKTIMISLDAMESADLDALGQNSFIRHLMEKGTSCTRLKTIFPALTYPTHVTQITGASPLHHGIGHNALFQPDEKVKDRAWFWDIAEIRQPTLFDAVYEAGGKSFAMMWPVTGKSKRIRWNYPEVKAIKGENQVKKMLEYGSPLFVLSMEMKYGRLRKGISEPNLSDYSTAICKDVIRHHAPDFSALHLVDLDTQKHVYGNRSKEAMEAIQRMDRRAEEVWNAAEQTNAMGDYLFILISDHGQADVNRLINLEHLLISCGLRDDFAVHSNGMSAYFYAMNNHADLKKLFMNLSRAGEQAGISHIYAREELDALGCVSGPVCAVEAAEGVVFSDRADTVEMHKATHGYGPGHRAENCLFTVNGKGIREGSTLAPMMMWDVAPTVAELMGVPFKCEDGKSVAKSIVG